MAYSMFSNGEAHGKHNLSFMRFHKYFYDNRMRKQIVVKIYVLINFDIHKANFFLFGEHC